MATTDTQTKRIVILWDLIKVQFVCLTLNEGATQTL